MKLKYIKSGHVFEIVEASKLEIAQVKLTLTRFYENYRFKKEVRLGLSDGTECFFMDNTYIPAGLWKEVAEGLQGVDCAFDVINKSDFPIDKNIKYEDVYNFCVEHFKDAYRLNENNKKVKFFPYDHQIETAFKILKNKMCIAEVATSGGKTLIISIIFFYILKHIKPDAKFLIVVPSILLVNQFTDEIMEFNYGKFSENVNPCDITIEEIMSDKPRSWRGVKEPNIIISTYQSLSNVDNFGKEFYKQFYAVAVDEGHQAKTTSIRKILDIMMKTTDYRFCVSGTFQRKETAESLLIQKLTGPKVNVVKAVDLQKKNIITNVKVKFITLNHQNKEFHDKLAKIRKNINKASIAYQMEGDYIRESKKRVKFICNLLFKCKANTLLLFNIKDYGNKLLTEAKLYYDKYKDELNLPEIEFFYIDGDIPITARNEIKANMEKDDGVIRFLFATYGTLSTGVSINNLHNVIFTESFKNERRIIQSIGRALRKHHQKTTAFIFDLVDIFKDSENTNSFAKHGKARKQLYIDHEYPYDEKIKYTL